MTNPDPPEHAITTTDPPDPAREPRRRARDLIAAVRAVGDRPLAAPPEKLRVGPLRDGAFTSPLRSERLTSQLGVALGVAFLVCFVTGYLSHAIQHPPGWFWWPPRPVGLYRVTQGLHVGTGIALVPLLGAKLWSVYPKLFAWPPARDVAHAVERGSVAVLVAASLFQVTTGILNTARWYAPMPFFFTVAHYWTGWLAIGALLVHIGVQLPVIRRGLSQAGRATAARGASTTRGAAGARETTGVPDTAGAREATGSRGPATAGLTRRGLLGTVAATSGLLILATAGQTVPWLAGLSVLGPRDPRKGPQGLPVNKSAAAAGVAAAATDPAYRLRVVGPGGTVELSLADLAAMPQYTVSLPIACVEGWSADAVWSGVRLRDLVSMVGPVDPDGAAATVTSLEAGSRYRSSVVAPPHVRDPLTLVALRLHGEPLALDHGFPCRLIAPDRPGVMQTKWLSEIRVGTR